LVQEQNLRSKAEKEASKIKQDASKAENEVNAAIKAELDTLKQTLATEKRERNKSEKAAQKAAADFEASKALLEDKLDQFRNKLRSTKETLKETQEELERARTRQQAAVPAVKNPRKRAAEPDAAIGTPGDAGAAAKRSKRASSVIGEKSNFTLTPLLNKTRGVSVIRDPPQETKQAKAVPEEEDAAITQPEKDQDPDEPLPSIEPASALNSPFTSRETSAAPAPVSAQPAKPTTKPLAPSSPGKANLKAKPTASRKKAAAPSKLAMVTEEEDDENLQPVAAPQQQDIKAPPAKSRLSLKPRSLSTFSSFRDTSLQPREQSMQRVQRKKHRMLGAAKTIFDEDDVDEAPISRGRLGSVGFGGAGQRAFGAFGAGFGGLVGKKKGPLVVAQDGFVFSPLKKQRKAMAEAARGVGRDCW